MACNSKTHGVAVAESFWRNIFVSAGVFVVYTPQLRPKWKKHEKIADGKCLLKNIKNNTNLYKTAVNICENGDDDGDFIRFIAGLYTFIYFRYKFSHNQQLLWAVVCVADRPDRLQNIVSNICKQFAAANGIEVARCIAFLSLSLPLALSTFSI